MLRKIAMSFFALQLLLLGITSASAATPLVVTFESDDTSGFIHIDFDDAGAGHQISSVVASVDGVG